MASIIERIRRRLVTDYQKKRYQQVASQVLQTPPLQPGSSPFMALSMVHQRDVVPYLVAIKSFYRVTRPQRIAIVCDPSIGDAERAIFKQHIPFAELRRAEEFQHPRIPKGGTWERLAAIASYSPETYVVQLDADTLTVAELPEVMDAVTQRQGFVIGEIPDQPLLTLAQTSHNARQRVHPHIQVLAEQNMADAGLSLPLYTRGCSGFTGFPSNPAMREQMFEFSEKMARVTQGRWAEWGTEQVTSNYLVANAARTRVLPCPKYSTPERDFDAIAFFHFIGYVRFVNSLYRVKTQYILPRLHEAIR
ncbi:hypothetical protein [Hydrogenophaga sp.]|uniref:hypothetical protein n=1 Tax=Hydrogenophaga sp. TaxID=1904254 RepID=UPI0026363FAC|nr:hypothetical protein [Hydrogenophaga sp.]MCW5652276.1 hypothetical protein [Hydrogenophaga sp.]